MIKKGADMETKIDDYRVRKSFSFGLYNAELDADSISNLLATRALYCYVDEDFSIVRFKDGELQTSKINLQTETFKRTATFKIEEIEIDEFEEHYIAHISGEKLFRNVFFSKDSDYIDDYRYFIFQPIIVQLDKNDKYYRLYPVVKVVNKQTVIVDFNYYPTDESKSVEDFTSMLVQIEDKFKMLKFPYSYLVALGIDVDTRDGEYFEFESNKTAIFGTDKIHATNILELSELFVSLLVDYDKYSWFGRTVISLGNVKLSNEQINLLKNGFKYEQINPLYNKKIINFSEELSTKFYVFEHMTLTTGEILETFMPATILDEELSILNTKMLVYSKIVTDEPLNELLKSKKELQLLKQQISSKYSSIRLAHTIMEYAINELFKINEKIETVDSLAEISFRQQEFKKQSNDNIFQILISFVSIILSVSAIFEYIIVPIYEIRFSKAMLAEDTLINFSTLIVLSFVTLLASYFFISRKRK